MVVGPHEREGSQVDRTDVRRSRRDPRGARRALEIDQRRYDAAADHRATERNRIATGADKPWQRTDRRTRQANADEHLHANRTTEQRAFDARCE